MSVIGDCPTCEGAGDDGCGCPCEDCEGTGLEIEDDDHEPGVETAEDRALLRKCIAIHVNGPWLAQALDALDARDARDATIAERIKELAGENRDFSALVTRLLEREAALEAQLAEARAAVIEDDDAADETGPLVPYGTHSVFRP